MRATFLVLVGVVLASATAVGADDETSMSGKWVGTGRIFRPDDRSEACDQVVFQIEVTEREVRLNNLEGDTLTTREQQVFRGQSEMDPGSVAQLVRAR